MHIQKEEKADMFLEQVYCEYRTFMLSVARVYIDDSQLREDIVHNAFIPLIRNEKRIKTLSVPQLRAYIVLAVRHASIDYLRKERKMNLADIPDDVLLDLVSQSSEAKTASTAPFLTVELRSVLQQLSSEDQTLLIGRYYLGLNSDELAAMFGCTAGALRVKLHRAGKRALALLKSQGLSLEDFVS